MPTCAAHNASPLVQLEVPLRLSGFGGAPGMRKQCYGATVDEKIRYTYFGLADRASGALDGLGACLFVNGDAYAGELCRGMRHGWGMFVGGGARYEGVWANGVRVGFGFYKASSNDGQYFGEFQRNVKEGKALVFSSGAFWRTRWKNGECVFKAPLFKPQEVKVEEPISADWVSRDSSSDEVPREQLDLWTPEMMAACLEAAGVAEPTCRKMLEHNISGAVLEMLVEDSSKIETLNIGNPYVRRFIRLIWLCLLGYQQRPSESLSPGDTTVSSSSYLMDSMGTSASRMAASGPIELHMKSLYLEKRIGEGGYGRVYRGRYEFCPDSPKLPVACKMFRPSEMRRRRTRNLLIGRQWRQTMLREFESEFRIHKRLRHPHIVMLYGIIRHPLYCVVSEYVACGSLFDLLHQHKMKLSLTSWMTIAEQIASALTYLHHRSIIHCDLKTSNVLITPSGSVKLCDFGLALPVEDHPTHFGCVGTLQWMAPETIRGESVTSASDVYSFGVILWEMITGKIPFKDVLPAHVAALVGYLGVSILGFDADVALRYLPPNVLNVLRACLHPDPRKRPSAPALCAFFHKARKSRFLDFEANLKTFFGV